MRFPAEDEKRDQREQRGDHQRPGVAELPPADADQPHRGRQGESRPDQPAQADPGRSADSVGSLWWSISHAQWVNWHARWMGRRAHFGTHLWIVRGGTHETPGQGLGGLWNTFGGESTTSGVGCTIIATGLGASCRPGPRGIRH